MRLFLSFYVFYFQDLSENHPGERVSWLKTIVILLLLLNQIRAPPERAKITGQAFFCKISYFIFRKCYGGGKKAAYSRNRADEGSWHTP